GTELAEVEAVAAHFLTTKSTLEKRFGVIVTEEDCREAGIVIDPQELGTTGVRVIDRRHRDLKGTTVEQFGRLIARVVQAMWQGEQQIRLYPAQQILGQIAIFSKLPEEEIDPTARIDCLDVLGRQNWHTFHDSPPEVRITGSLKDTYRPPIDFPIRAQRR